MITWLLLTILCMSFGEASLSSCRSDVHTIPYQVPDIYSWNMTKRFSWQDDENFYEFMNRITHGKIYNMSMSMHDILEKAGHHLPPIDPVDIPKFNCSVDQNKVHAKATSVHRLTPYDIAIVAAMGDSLTAGFGALSCTLIDLFVEYRGVSWSIGGDSNVDKYVTLPNILKEYNPNLKGYAKFVTPPLIPFPNEHLDVAVSGATSYGMLSQAERLVEKLVMNPEYDFFGSWKVLTLFIGGNDLCSCCRRWNDYNIIYSPKNYVREVKKALDYLHERVPKMLINLVNAPDVTIIHDLASFKCDFTHLIECKCGTVFGKYARNYTRGVVKKYHQLLRKLVLSGQYDTRDDFTVVLQPFFDETQIPRLPNGDVDRRYFAPDCFHFSGRAHAASALALWNNMLEPVGRKNKEWHTGEKYHCPNESSPYFFTNLNSNRSVDMEKFDGYKNCRYITFHSNSNCFILQVNAVTHSFYQSLTRFGGEHGRKYGSYRKVMCDCKLFLVLSVFIFLCITILLIKRFMNIRQTNEHRCNEKFKLALN